MEHLVFEFALRSLLIAVAAAFVLAALRIRTAAAQHAVFTGVLMNNNRLNDVKELLRAEIKASHAEIRASQAELFAMLNARFGELDVRFAALDFRLSRIEERLSHLEADRRVIS